MLDSGLSCLAVEMSSMTSVSVDQFHFMVAGRVVEENMSLSRSGVTLDGTVCMRSRLEGGVKTGFPGTWTCMVCTWPIRQSCFRCGSPRGPTSPSPPARGRRYRGTGGQVAVVQPFDSLEREHGGFSIMGSENLSQKVFFIAIHCVVNVVIAPNAMIGE